ncbi:helix-turn-helix domain-containing protein [Aureisphaera galaxeae]|uniref:helix-turn-helix domain-containing protein n=1 Tax=Aureisphaera galaxeae TaxID=1538023 RepID=UPI0023502BC7|nr:helix-turn-helix domain-containing protein [Aureisphaera galaxeae]MDC8002813.1 helix-turn-helix domain-containing protein [Aureisphaera galaxeae]
MLVQLPLTFPSFNLYSTPLLILVLQGLVFAGLLFVRYGSKKNISDLLLGSILLITCYHRTTYTIGFMDWYDTYRNTKINYYLINLGLVLAPLLYFYVKSITVSDFKFKKKDIWHFVPWMIFFALKMVILIYDAQQPGFSETQNGYLVVNFQWKYLDPFHSVLLYSQMLLYLAFTFQLYYHYRKNIQQFFSNAYSLELNWIRNFLFIYALLFLYDIGQTIVNLAITELSWTQKWWLHFFNALAIIYIGVKGYFTDTGKLKGLQFDGSKALLSKEMGVSEKPKELVASLKEKVINIEEYFQNEKPYLNPELNLVNLSEALSMNRAELSEVINVGFNKNFNDFVNAYRVEAFKEKLSEGKHEQLSLLGIAYECGFNSKATFNRVFKKLTEQSPTQYLSSL